MDFAYLDGVKVPATYLGDAVYVLHDGYGYWLRLNSHRNTEGQIYLEPVALTNLIHFKEQCDQLRAKDAERKEPENLASPNTTQEG